MMLLFVAVSSVLACSSFPVPAFSCSCVLGKEKISFSVRPPPLSQR
ncbi:hypothetical protein A2U01_0091388, partial [Trifolium medium]|nr:hypothetical protein [Trifolium medium]